jgi:hypothetical protein
MRILIVMGLSVAACGGKSGGGTKVIQPVNEPALTDETCLAIHVAGFATGGVPYGYRTIPQLDQRGKSTGDPEQARADNRDGVNFDNSR